MCEKIKITRAANILVESDKVNKIYTKFCWSGVERRDVRGEWSVVGSGVNRQASIANRAVSGRRGPISPLKG